MKGDIKMKKFRNIAVICLTAALLVCCAAGCGSNSSSESKKESSTASTVGDTSKSEESSANESSAESQASTDAEASVDIKTADYSNPAVTIEFGDFELIKTVTNDMQTGKYDGKVIKVTGISEKRMSSCSIMEKDESTGTGYGMTYYLDGKPDLSEYPAEDAKVTILGVVTIEEYGVRALTVLPEKITVLEKE